MIKFFYRIVIDLTNNLYINNILRHFSNSKISRYFVPTYAKVFNINMGEYGKKLNEFQNLHDFFIRALKDDVRKVDTSTKSVVSPVDGFVEDMGTIKESKDIKVKGKIYSFEEMVGNDNAFAKYKDGVYVIIYLSPSDYHRIHSPVSGVVVSQWSLGRHSYPVNKWGLQYGREPLTKNYRLITEVQTEQGHIAIVKVGAMFINSIETTHKNDHLIKGEEMAYFSFGSTVVLLFESGIFQPNENLMGKKIKFGDTLGFFSK